MLRVRIGEDKLSFTREEGGVKEQADYTLQPGATFTASLREAFTHVPLLQKRSDTTEVVVTSGVTFVSLADFEEDECVPVFGYCFPERAKENVFYDAVPEASVILLFGLPKENCEALEALFGDVHYVSELTPWLRKSVRNATGDTRRCSINCRPNWVDIAVAGQNHLLFCNTFEVRAAADVVYFALSAAKRLQLPMESTEFVVTGEKSRRQDVVAELKKYVDKVKALAD